MEGSAVENYPIKHIGKQWHHPHHRQDIIQSGGGGGVNSTTKPNEHSRSERS